MHGNIHHAPRDGAVGARKRPGVLGVQPWPRRASYIVVRPRVPLGGGRPGAAGLRLRRQAPGGRGSGRQFPTARATAAFEAAAAAEAEARAAAAEAAAAEAELAAAEAAEAEAAASGTEAGEVTDAAAMAGIHTIEEEEEFDDDDDDYSDASTDEESPPSSVVMSELLAQSPWRTGGRG